MSGFLQLHVYKQLSVAVIDELVLFILAGAALRLMITPVAHAAHALITTSVGLIRIHEKRRTEVCMSTPL